MKKIIKYYRTNQFGTVREFIHPECAGDAKTIRQLTGAKTINSVVRELLRDLTGCMVDFEEVAQPLSPL